MNAATMAYIYPRSETRSIGTGRWSDRDMRYQRFVSRFARSGRICAVGGVSREMFRLSVR